MRPVIIILLALALATTAFAYPNNPPTGYAGNPPANNNCTSCHSGNPLNAPGGTLTISGLPVGGYVPGTTYHLTVTQARSGLTRWGFESTTIYQSGTSWLKAGTLVVTDATHTNLAVGSGTNPDYIRQTTAGTYAGTPGPTSWNFDWTAPATAVGPIGVYAAGMAANNNGSESGDWVYTTSTTISPASAGPSLDVTLTPLNPPIVVPALGGQFSFNVSIRRVVGPAAPYAVWARIKNPDGTYTAPTLGPVTINTPVGVTVTRTRNQTVPGTWVAGLYTYLAYVNTSFVYPAIDSSSFTWTKSATANGGPLVWEAVCSGELFPGEIAVAAPENFTVAKAYPNPFNPSTVLSFELRVPSLVKLNVYDTAGRLVATLIEGWQEAGTHQARFDGSQLASGVYLYTLSAGANTFTGKMLLLK